MTTGPMNIDGGMMVGEVYVDAGVEVRGKTKTKDMEVTGDLLVAGATATGALTAQPSVTTGTVNAGSGSFTGAVSSSSITASGAMSAGSVSATGPVVANAVRADAGTFVTVVAQSYAGGTASLTSLDVAGPASLGPNVTLRGTVTTENPLQAPSVSADAGTFGALLAGGSTLGPPVNLTGPVSVSGTCSFSQPPTGLVRKGSLVRGASLGLAIGCQTLGTAAVTGTTVDSGCMVTQRPAAILNLGVVLDCYVTSPATVTIRACALVALLSAPAGNYGVTLVGE